MAQSASIVTQALAGFLADPETGLGPAIERLAADAGLTLDQIPAERVILQNLAAPLAERAVPVKYPVVYVYADRVQNLLREKFRTFSGKVRTVAEVRASQDRIEELESRLRLYVDATTQVLDGNRGSWGQGIFFTGQYEVRFDPVMQGGRNFLQIAKVIFEVDLSS